MHNICLISNQLRRTKTIGVVIRNKFSAHRPGKILFRNFRQNGVSIFVNITAQANRTGRTIIAAGRQSIRTLFVGAAAFHSTA